MKKGKDKCNIQNSAQAGVIYCLGVIGAAVYYIGKTQTFWTGVLGFLKALVWPAFLVYGLLKSIGM